MQVSGKRPAQHFRLIEAAVAKAAGVKRNRNECGRWEDRQVGRRNTMDKFLREVGDAAVLEGLDGFSDNAVVVKKARQTVK